MPVWVADAPEAGGSRLSRLDVQVIDRATVPEAWRDGMVLRMTAPQGAGSKKTRLSVDYREFQKAYGADWASRLKLWQVPRCALDTPAAADCRSVALPSTVDKSAGTVSATVAVDSGATGAVNMTAAARTTAAASTGSFVALAAAPSGDSGDFTATSLAPSSTWSAGGNSGEFSWSYPMRVPPAAGPTPGTSLAYSSAAVDGRSEVTNNQPSWIGEGFDYTPGFIERRYVPCAQDSKDGANSTKYIGDLCWRSDNATVSLGGSSSELVFQAGKGWHNRTEDGSKIEKLTGAGNGDTGDAAKDGVGEHWRVTTADGTQYYFGLDDLPGETDPTNSTLNVPVFGNHSGEPCHQSGFMASDCVQAYRWNLDYVVDVRGNTMSYWYGKETNKYAQNATDSSTAAYDRAGYLTRIDYGTYDRTQAVHGVTERNTNPHAQIEFTTDGRCFTNCGTESAPTTANWKDTPWDQNCKASATSCPKQFSPTFWTTKRLKTVTTRVWDTTVATPKWQDVDSWTLTHTFSATADTTHTGLWLEKIDHAGLVGGQVNLPPVTFEAKSMPNRVLTENTSTNNWLRISSIVTETGARIKVDYTEPDCTEAIIGSLKAHTNTRRCYPVKVPSNADPGGDVMVEEWWHKYLVTHVAEDDLQISNDHPAPSKHTRYEYVGAPAWHYADDDGLVPANRKTWDQWRGYAEVRTSVGDEADTRTLTVTKFLRGMHGDRAAPSGGTRPVTVPASVGSETVYDHDQFAGMIREQATFNGVVSKPVSKTVSVPWRSNPLASRTINGDTVEARYVNTQVTYSATALGVDGSRGWRTSSSRSDFDHTYGTVNWSQDDGDTSKTGDEKCVSHTYNRNTAKNLTGTVSRTLTTALTCGASPASSDDVVADTRTYFDGAGSLTTAPIYGSATKVEQLKDWTPGTGTVWQTVSQFTYDSTGRAKTTTDIRNNVSEATYVPAVGGPVTKVSTKNPLSWTSTVDTNPYWGSATKQTDPNGRITADVDYDAMGRVARVWKLGWTRAANATKPSAQYEYKFAANRDAYPYVRSQTLNAAANYITSYQISDALLRPRQTQTLSKGGGGDRVVTDTIYDEFGRAATSYGAHAEPGAPSGVLWWEPEWSVPTVGKTVFDRASRPTASILLGGDNITNLVEKWRTTTAYEGDLTKVTPPRGGTPTTTVTDIAGRVTALRQHTTPAGVNGAYTETTYTFNRKDQQSKVSDSDKNEWTSTYDAKGRLVRSIDPDKGKTDLAYNDFNELESTTDARGEKLWFSYDTLGRKKQVRDDSATGPLRIDLRYDTLTDTTPGFRGQLTQSVRYEPAGSANAYKWQVRGFNGRYQPTGVNYVIPTAETGLDGTYIVGFGYAGATGEPTTLSYPAGGGLVTEQLTTHYHPSTGMPARLDTSLTGWEGTMATAYFTAYGERTGSNYQMRDNPWAQDTIYRDESTRRIQRTTVGRQTVAGTVSDRNYDYDEAGNILSIEEKPAVGAGEKQCFRTDPLGRLTTAWTPKPELPCTTDPTVGDLAGPAPYWQDWTFTDTGSRKTETTHAAAGNTIRDYAMPVGGPNVVRPHAVTSMTTTAGSRPATTTQYRYDANGNMTCRPTAGSTSNNCDTNTNTQTLNWDAEGELATVTTGANTIEASVYDANGDRLIRRDATGTTLYLPGQEIRREGTTNTGTRYYSFAGTTFASRTASSAITDLTWLFSDHQGTQQISINAGTQAVTTRRQTPYGSERGTNPMWVNNKTFVGGDTDPTGLINIGARRYDRDLGRFISVDPLMDLADPQQWNGYNYANNSPITQSDPDGLDPRPWHDPGYTPDKCAKSTSLECHPTGKTKYPITHNPATGTNDGSPHGAAFDLDKDGYISRPEMTEFDLDYDGRKDYSCAQRDWGCIAGKALGGVAVVAVGVVTIGGAIVCLEAVVVCATRAGDAALDSVAPGTVVAGTAGAAKLGSQALEEGGSAAASRAAKMCAGAKSFDGDTQVLMADGSTKKFKDLHEGDEVLATDPETGEQGPREIETIWVHNDDLSGITVDGQRLLTTEDHPFWNESDKQWQGAEQLDAGDLVRTPTGTARVTGFDAANSQFGPAYNLTVADIHTYYVLAGNTPVLVHNQGGEPKPGQIYLWRAVTESELRDVTNTRKWSSTQGIKYFAFSEEGASQYARYAYGAYPKEGPYTMLRTTVKLSDLPEDARMTAVDVKSGGVALTDDQLKLLGRPSIMPSMSSGVGCR
ncbi:RHS repeat-associated core domain-containing protein [Actinoplanes sandaracinus]|uniref:RHS repeat-associated core domain-containing protein n=1 Tax=Actinoplanes sandaracinus TaxID=3045177 RepID=UPI00389903CD